MKNADGNYELIGKKIRVARINRGLRQYELAERSNLSANYISLIESGKKKPSLRTLRILAGVLEVKISSLLDENDSVLNDFRDIAQQFDLPALIEGLTRIQNQSDA